MLKKDFKNKLVTRMYQLNGVKMLEIYKSRCVMSVNGILRLFMESDNSLVSGYWLNEG